MTVRRWALMMPCANCTWISRRVWPSWGLIIRRLLHQLSIQNSPRCSFPIMRWVAGLWNILLTVRSTLLMTRVLSSAYYTALMWAANQFERVLRESACSGCYAGQAYQEIL